MSYFSRNYTTKILNENNLRNVNPTKVATYILPLLWAKRVDKNQNIYNLFPFTNVVKNNLLYPITIK